MEMRVSRAQQTEALGVIEPQSLKAQECRANSVSSLSDAERMLGNQYTAP